MDSEEKEKEEEEEKEKEGTEIGMGDYNKKKGIQYVVLRLTFLGLLFSIFALFFLFISMLFLAVLVGQSPIVTPISVSVAVPSQCRILSSGVDLRSSKVCQLGLLNYKAKEVFYPFDKTKFRCRFDYYWASVFEVEYKDHSLGQTRLALAEAPNEALPINCRPNFRAAWLTKHKFKVNETYDCWYTSGISKVTLYRDGFFSCQAKDPSPLEMIRRYFIVSIEILHSFFFRKKGKTNYWRWETMAGVVAGFSTSLITICFVRIIQLMKSSLPQTVIHRMVGRVNMVFIKRACFLVAYFSLMGWLTIQYGKRLGLPELYRIYNY